MVGDNEYSFSYTAGASSVTVTFGSVRELHDFIYDFINFKKFGIVPCRKRRGHKSWLRYVTPWWKKAE